MQIKVLSRTAVTRLLYAILIGCVALFAVGAASAHIPSLIYSEQEVVDSSPGETVELNVVMADNGGYRGSGVKRIEFVATYEQEYVRVVDVEPVGWLDRGQSTDVFTNITVDNAAGRVNVTEWRDPPRKGVIGEYPLVTLTLEIAADAPENNTEISYHKSDITHVNGWYVKQYVTNTTIALGEVPSGSTPQENDDSGALPSGVPFVPIVVAAVALYLCTIAVVWRGV